MQAGREASVQVGGEGWLLFAGIALMVAGGTLVFGGELSEFARRSCVAALAIAFLVLGAGFMTSLFGVGGATVF